MRILPGFGTFSSRSSDSQGAYNINPKTISEVLTISDSHKQWYGRLNMRNDFTNQKGEFETAENEIDAFRHAYTITVGSRTTALILDGANAFEWYQEWSGSRPSMSTEMDRFNNNKAAEILRELAKTLKRDPTNEEIAIRVAEALINDELRVNKPNGKDGWKERLQNEVNKLKQERELKNWVEKVTKERPSRGDAHQPRDYDRIRESPKDRYRDFDRIDSRPGYGGGKTKVA